MTHSVEEIRKEDFYVEILRFLQEVGGAAANQEIDGEILERFGFSEEDAARTHEASGTPILLNRIAWARTYLKLGGLANNSRSGFWEITDEGRQALDAGEEAVKVVVRDATREYHRRKREEQDGGLADAEDALEVNSLTWNEIILGKLKTVDPTAFERLCQRILREAGFTKVEVTGRSGDGGIDGNGVLRVKLVSFAVLFQCKRYAGSVGPSTIRDFRGAMQGRADKGLLITTGTFTAEARREATRDGAPALDLLDGDSLCDLIKDLKLGVKN